MKRVESMISVVVPVFNEEESLNDFYKELIKYLPKLSENYEIIFIDDGSTDTSFAILKRLEKKDKHIRIFSLRRNIGKAEALSLGFYKARGDIIVTLDADLQDQPSEIQKLLNIHQTKGIDVVCGWRKNRKDKSKMKIISKLFNIVVRKLFDVNIHDYNCGLKLYTKEAAKSLRLYGGMHRFIPVLVYEMGFSVDEVPVRHEMRKFGKSKYGFSKIFKDMPDMFTMLFLVRYMNRPLHFFGIAGGVLAFIGVAILTYLSVLRFMGERIGTRPLLFLGILLVLVGIQIFFTGFLAELMINVAHRERMNYPIKYQTGDVDSKIK
ncbi:MAG: dolichol-phosphate mannosyltransferase [Patescibacteria group bacterium]|nr:MAG: dolichol-phosphate mannosyltransferase [Patescibacteria group bacterium]